MDDKEIFKILKKYKIVSCKDFIKEFIFVPKESFCQFKSYFIQDGARGNYLSYRTNHWFRHLHAKEYQDRVDLHFDHGNFSKYFVLVIIHIIFDFIPFQIFSFARFLKVVLH